MNNEVVTIEAAAINHAVQTTPADLLRMAVQGGADLDKLERLLELQERWEKREAEKAYSAAFAAFKAEAVSIIKNKTVTDGPLKGKSYAELFAVVDAVTPALSKHGLSSSWRLTKDERDWIEVTCTLRHVLGHSDSVSMGGPPDTGGAKNHIQARGSSISYLERYTLKAICGLSERSEDDDGGPGVKPPKPEKKTITPTDGIEKMVTGDRADTMDEYALQMIEHWHAGAAAKAVEIYYDESLFKSSDERVFLWSRLKTESALRTYLKNHNPRDEKK